MGQINYECEFGVVHSTGRCRCTDSHVTKRQIKCDTPDSHSKQFMDEVETGEKMLNTLNERLTATVEGYFGAMIMPVIKKSLVDKLEQDVSEWLIEAAESIRNKE